MVRRTRNNHPQANMAPANQSRFTPPDEHLDISMLETWLWAAACAIRGSIDAPKFKDFILPLVFFKRLSDVFKDEFATHDAKIASLGHETRLLDKLFRVMLDELTIGRNFIRSYHGIGLR